jgi:hypothetical protein
MHVDVEALLALAGLDPMPRQELVVNPCPEGYQLKNIGGSLMCILEGAESMSLAQALALSGDRSPSAAYRTRLNPSTVRQSRPSDASGGIGGIGGN